MTRAALWGERLEKHSSGSFILMSKDDNTLITLNTFAAITGAYIAYVVMGDAHKIIVI